MRQKFVHGDLVQIAKKLPDMMRHFQSGSQALVIGSYDDQFGKEDTGTMPEYSLMLLPSGEEVSLYPESCLTFIEHKGAHYVRKIKEEYQDKCFEEDKVEMLKEGLVPGRTHRNQWKKIGT